MGFKNTLKVCSTVVKKPFSSLPRFELLLLPFQLEVLLGDMFLAGGVLFFLQFLPLARYEESGFQKAKASCIFVLVFCQDH